MSVTDKPSEEFLSAWLRLLRRRVAWAGGVFIVVLGLAVVVLVLARPVYRAEARLRLGEPPPMSGVSPTAGILSVFQLGGDAFSNDLEVFGSRTLAEGLVSGLALSVDLDAPRGVFRDAIFRDIAVSEGTEKKTFNVRWDAPNRVTVTRVTPTDSTVGSFETGVPASFDGVRAVFLPRSEDGPAEVHIRTVPFGEAVRSTLQGLSLARPRREANVLEVSYSDQDPGVAQAVVSEAVSLFLAMRSQLLERESGETVDSLRIVAAATRSELRVAEEEVEALQRESALIAPDAQSEALVVRYSELVGQLDIVRAELAALDTQLGRVEEAETPTEAWTTLLAHPRFLDNQTMGEILGRLTELQAALTEASTRRAPGSREIQALEEQIAQLESVLGTIAIEFRGALIGQVTDLEERVSAMDRALASVPRQALELGRSQRTARLLTEVLLVTEQRLRQEEIRQALTFSNVQVIDSARLEYRPIWPRTKLGLVVGFILALGSAFLAAVVVERADALVRTEADLRRSSGAPVLAVIVVRGGRPQVSPDDAAALRHTLGQSAGVVAPVAASVDLGPLVDDLTALGIDIRSAPSPGEGFGAAVEAMRGGGRIVLVATAGLTRRGDVARAVRNVEEAGGGVAGSIVLVRSDSGANAFSR